MEENKNISQIALDRIKEQGIKPISRNIFNIKKVLVWSFAGFAVLIGAISFTITLSSLFSNDWYLVDKFGYAFIFKTLPYFWFICLVVFVILGECYYRKTYLGYRHRITMVIGAYILITIILGAVLHLFNLGEKIEGFISENIPVYRNIVFDKESVWSQPETGLISGRILEVNNNFIKIIDLKNNIWIINRNEAKISQRVKMEVGGMIKIIGGVDSDINDKFNADQIKPWMGLGPHAKCCIPR